VTLRPLAESDRDEVVEFLDRRTLALRWLVAFLRHWDLLPEEAEPYWSFWRDDGAELRGVLAHFFHTGTTYVSLDPGADLAAIESLCREDLLPERIAGDRDVLDGWMSASPSFFAGAARVIDLEILTFRPAEAAGLTVAAGFRAAAAGDRPALEELDRLLSRERGEAVSSDYESLIAKGLIFVEEESGRVAGAIRSNLPDGRYVHGGGLYVHPERRGRGAGRRLALGLGRRVEESGQTALLDCDATNEAALRAYRAAGYRPLGRGLEVRFPERV
jgi:ribosomal protein S18 acetylase RimI-like enzyme